MSMILRSKHRWADQALDRADRNPWLMINSPTPDFAFGQQVASTSGLTVVPDQPSMRTNTFRVWYPLFEVKSPSSVLHPGFLRWERTREVRWRKRRLEFRREIEYSLTREDDLFVIEYEPLGIRAYAEGLAEAKRDFAEEFFVLWEDFGLAPDEELAPEGVRLKQDLLQLVLQETGVDEAQGSA